MGFVLACLGCRIVVQYEVLRVQDSTVQLRVTVEGFLGRWIGLGWSAGSGGEIIAVRPNAPVQNGTWLAWHGCLRS